MAMHRKSGQQAIRARTNDTATKSLTIATAYCAPVSTVWADQQRNGQVAGVRDTVYGSDAYVSRFARAVLGPPARLTLPQGVAGQHAVDGAVVSDEPARAGEAHRYATV